VENIHTLMYLLKKKKYHAKKIYPVFLDFQESKQVRQFLMEVQFHEGSFHESDGHRIVDENHG
jgi:hypothetical protein